MPIRALKKRALGVISSYKLVLFFCFLYLFILNTTMAITNSSKIKKIKIGIYSIRKSIKPFVLSSDQQHKSQFDFYGILQGYQQRNAANCYI